MKAPAAFPRVSVILPTLNEAENLPYVLPSVAKAATEVNEVILIDGHSTDNTIQVAQRLLPDIKAVKQAGKGKGDALRCGFAASTGEIIVVLDADGSMDPQEIPRFVETLVAGADVAKGSRFIRGGGTIDITRLRWMGNRMLNIAVNWLFRIPFTDLCYGYNAFWRECLDFFEVDCDGFEVETQIILRARKANLKIVEVPSYEYPRIYGTSHLRTFRDGWRVLKTIGREWVSGYSTIKTPGMHRYATHQPVNYEAENRASMVREPVGARWG